MERRFPAAVHLVVAQGVGAGRSDKVLEFMQVKKSIRTRVLDGSDGFI